MQIFDRDAKPTQLTEEGEALLPHAKAVLYQMEKLADAATETVDSLEGDFHLGMLPTLTPYLVPRFVTKFVKKYPGINFIVHEWVTEDLCAAIERRELDVAILSGPLGRPQFEERPLFEEQYICYLSPGHRLLSKRKLRDTDLTLCEIWLLTDGHCFRNDVLNFCHAIRDKKSPDKRIWFESGSLETLKQLIDAGHGYSLFPELAVDQLASSAEKKRTRTFMEPAPRRHITMVNGRYFNKHRLLSVVHKELINALPSHMKLKKRRTHK